MKVLVIFLTLVLSGCGGLQIQVRGEGMGAVGLTSLATALQDVQKKVFCPQGIAAERREMRVTTNPNPDPLAYPPTPEVWVNMDGKVICR